MNRSVYMLIFAAVAILILTIVCSTGVICAQNSDGVLLNGFSLTNPEWKGDRSFPDAEQARILSISPEHMKHLDGVFDFDVENNKRFDMTPEQISNSETDDLVRHFVCSPLSADFLLYGDINFGITRVARSSATLSAIIKRKDAVDGILRYYKGNTLNPRDTDMEAAKTSLQLMTADELLMYPLIFPQIKGHEAQTLRYICDRHKTMEKANASRPKDKPKYSVLINTSYELASMLEKRLDGTVSNQPPSPQKALSDEQTLFKRCEKLLSDLAKKGGASGKPILH